MDTVAGRVLADRAGGLRPEPAAQSQPIGAHPSRDPMRTCTCTDDDPDLGCVDHGDGSTWEMPSNDESVPDGWLADGSWAA